MPPDIIEADDMVSVGDLTQSTWGRDIGSTVQGSNEKHSKSDNKFEKSSMCEKSYPLVTISNDRLPASDEERSVIERKSLTSNNDTLTENEDDASYTELTVGENTVRSILEAKATLKRHASRLGVQSLFNRRSEATIKTLQSGDARVDDCISIGSDTKASIDDAKQTLKDHATYLGVKELMNDGEISIKTVKSDDGSECSDQTFDVWGIIDDCKFCVGISSGRGNIKMSNEHQSAKRVNGSSKSRQLFMSDESMRCDSSVDTDYYSVESSVEGKLATHSGSRTV